MEKDLIYTVKLKVSPNRDVYENRLTWCIDNAGNRSKNWNVGVLHNDIALNIATYTFDKEECASEFALRFS